MLLGLLCLAGLASAVAFLLRQLDLIPPEALTIAAGSPGSAYYETALAYQEVLARDDIELRILESAGSVENARLLEAEEGADIALVQGGVPLGEEVQGLAALRMEPLWAFARLPMNGDPNTWADLRLAAGPDGSGTRLIADALVDISGAGALSRSRASELGGAEAAAALLAGDIDIALFVAPAEAPYLQTLLRAQGVSLQTLAHGESIAARLPGAQLVNMPSGILDYQRALPKQDTQLVAVAMRLVANADIHPALVNRLVHAIVEVHGGSDIIPADARYPAATDLAVELNGYAQQLLDKGFSPLEQFLPYWIVAQLNRVLLILLPAVFLLLPLMKILPAGYQWFISRRVYRHYGRIHDIDAELLQSGPQLGAERVETLRAELDEIEAHLLKSNLPNIYRKQAYTLLHHLDYVRRRSELVMKDVVQ